MNPIPWRPLLLATVLLISPSFAIAQQAPLEKTCASGQSHCETTEPRVDAGSTQQQESWTQETGSEEPQQQGAWVRDVPEDYIPPAPPVEWVWVSYATMETTNVPNNMCARSVGQALSWLMGPASNKDEPTLNRALSAYDWRGVPPSTADNMINWIRAWPPGSWEQQTRVEGGISTPIRRFRYVSDAGTVHTWVRVVKAQGCWMVTPSEPKEPSPSPTNDTELEQSAAPGNLIIVPATVD